MRTSLTPSAGDALLIIDVQRDFCPGGALAVPDGDRVVPVINRIMDAFSTVVLTQDWHPAAHRSFASAHPGRAPFETTSMPYGEQVLWPDHCVQGQPGAAFHPDLRTDPAQVIVRKGTNPAIDSYSGFFENDGVTATGLGGFLRDRGIGRVVCCGLATDFCVLYTVKDARRLGLEVVVLEDACRGLDIDGRGVAAALAEMVALGAERAASDLLTRP